MKVIMIGTPTCIKCKITAPKLEKYCEEHQIEYNYMHLSDAPLDIIRVLVDSNVKQAPAFLIYLEDDIRVISGSDIFVELDSVNK